MQEQKTKQDMIQSRIISKKQKKNNTDLM